MHRQHKRSHKRSQKFEHTGHRTHREGFSNRAEQDAKEDDAGNHAEHADDDLDNRLRRDVTIADGQHCHQHEVCAPQPPGPAQVIH